MDTEPQTLTARYTWGPNDRVAYRKAIEFHRATFAPMTFTQSILQFGWVALLAAGTVFTTLIFVENEGAFRLISGDNYDALKHLIKSKVLIASWMVCVLAILSNVVFYRSVMNSFFNIFKGTEYSLEINADGISLSSMLGQQNLTWPDKTAVKVWNNWLFVVTPNMSFVIPSEAINMPVDDALEAVNTWAKAKSAAPLS